MERYKNLGGNSNVSAYEIGADYIKVQFRDSAIYTYDGQKAGMANVEHMKMLATAGHGLNSFINLHVKTFYSSKSR